MAPPLSCAGLPLNDERSLTPEELSRIRSWARRIMRRSLGFVARIFELTAVPEYARIDAKWAVPLPDRPRVSIRDRLLSPEERGELSGLAMRFFPARRIVLVLVSCAFLVGIAMRYGPRAFVAETPFWAFLAWWSYRLSK
jgi:hypothetical protein